MTEKIKYSDKLLFQIETSRGMTFGDASQLDYYSLLKLLELAGFNIRSPKPIKEYLEHRINKDETIEFYPTWITTNKFKPRLVLESGKTEKEIRKSDIYKHFMGHTSNYKSGKVRIHGDEHKAIILGRISRGIGFPDISNSFCRKIDLDNHIYFQPDPLYKDCVNYDSEEIASREEYLQRIIADLVKDHGTEPIYIARSLSGGYHLYFRISDHFFNNSRYHNYFCQKYGYNKKDIEISSTSRGMRIPGHWTYTPGTWDSEYNAFIPDENRTDFIDRFLDNYNKPEFISRCKNFEAWLVGLSSSDELDEFYEEVRETIKAENEAEYLADIAEDDTASQMIHEPQAQSISKKVWDTKKINVFRRRSNSKASIDTENIPGFLKFGAGTRNYKLYEIACYTAHTDFETYIEFAIKAHDGSSKDFKGLSRAGIEKMLKPIWQNVQRRKKVQSAIKPANGAFISNADLVNDTLKRRLEKSSFTSFWLKECELVSDYNKVNEKHHHGMANLFIEMTGTMEYQHRNKRKLLPEYKDRTDLCEGFIFSKPWCDAVKVHYGITFDVYRAVLKILYWLRENCDIWNTFKTSDGKDYQFFGIVYCRQFCPSIYREQSMNRVSQLINSLTNLIDSLYSSGLSVTETNSTHMMYESSLKGPWIIESNGLKLPCPPI